MDDTVIVRFYKSSSFSHGSGVGKSTLFCVYTQAYDEQKALIVKSPYNQQFNGRWGECKRRLSKMEKFCESAGLKRIY